MPQLRSHRTDPRVADWLVSNAGGWSIGDAEAHHAERLDFEETDLTAVRDAVLVRLDVTGAELRSACAHERRKTRLQGTGTVVGLPPDVLAHLGVARGDSLDFTLMPDGSVALRRAPDVDVPAVRERIRRAGISPRLLGRLFFVPESTVRRIVKGGSGA